MPQVSTERLETLHHPPEGESPEALVELFVSALGSGGIAPSQLTVAADYGSLAHTPEGAADSEFRAQVTAIGAALADSIELSPTGSVHLEFSGVRTTGSVHCDVSLEGVSLTGGRLADAVARHGGALLDWDETNAKVALYPPSLPGRRRRSGS